MVSAPSGGPLGDHVLTRADGRRVAWSEWGKGDAPTVLLLHRNPGSRLFDPDPEATVASNARLITMDRPGYGRTDPVTSPTFEVVSSDISSVIDDLDLDEVALVGWSGGGMLAVHAAAALGNRVRSLSLVCTPAPDKEIPWIPDAFRPLMKAVSSDPAGALASITAACGFYADDPDAMAESDPSAADAEVRSCPEIKVRLVQMMREGARQGAIGMASDVVAGSNNEALPFDEVQEPVRLWYGDADWIGQEHSRWYAERMQNAKLTVIPGAGHLQPLTSWGAILDAA